MDNFPVAHRRASISQNRVRWLGVSTPIEDYAFLSNRRSAALVSRDGSMDWLCLPRFDSPAIFAAILGTPAHGRWQISIRGAEPTQRRYRTGTLTLETLWESVTGAALVTDVMTPPGFAVDVVRQVQCLRGSVTVDNDFRPTADYGLWPIYPEHDRTLYVTGNFATTISLQAGEELQWTISATFPESDEPEDQADPVSAIEAADRIWGPQGADEKEGISLLVLEGLIHAETGGMVAAPTASLPELFGGGRNWDYRYTWLRDSAFSIEVLVRHGYISAAKRWRKWLRKTLQDLPEDLQIMYGIDGEMELPERVIDHLPGYENSAPVRVGNGAAEQYQADVAGEVMLALGKLREAGIKESKKSWKMQCKLIDYVLKNWDRRDHGIWEMRGELHYFTHGRVMMWAALDQAIRACEDYGLEGDVELWRERREMLRDEILTRGIGEYGGFVQTYDGSEVDASLLQIPMTGFVPADHPVMLKTVEKIEDDLVDKHGFVYRYRTEAGFDGLEGHEYPFLICAFWLVEQYAASGRLDDAEALYERLISVSTDLGLLAEEYDPVDGRLAGNFPQAFSHLGVVRAIDAIRIARGEPLN
ncbi:Glycoside hydrolase 15-related protein [Corynebacterium renale]|nr:Glycoside hydrolase 15-related protein [Corynebacterium renale]